MVAVGDGKTIGKNKVGISVQVNIVLKREKGHTLLLYKRESRVNFACWAKSFAHLHVGLITRQQFERGAPQTLFRLAGLE